MGRLLPRAVALLFVLAVLELVLGVGGHVFEITETVSIRVILFAMILLLGIGDVAVKGYLKLGKLSSLFALIGMLTFLQGSIVGLIHGNQAKYIVGDANAFLFPLYAIAAFHFATENHWSLHNIIKLVLTTVTLLAAGIDAVYLGFRFGYLDGNDAVQLSGLLESTFRFAIVIQYPDKIYFINELFVFATIFIVLSLSVITASHKVRVGMILILCTLIVTLVASDSRGLQLGFLAGFVVSAVLLSRMLKDKLFGSLAVLLISAATIVGSMYHKTQLRIVHSFNMTGDMTEFSNKDRFGDAQILWEAFKESPLWGNGFGSTIEGVVKSVQNPYSFELVPLEVLMKLGILGPLMWFLFLVRMGLEMKRAITRAGETPLEKSLIIGSAGGLCAILVAGMTNPYLNSSIGMGTMVFFTLVVDLIQKDQFIFRLKKESIPPYSGK